MLGLFGLREREIEAVFVIFGPTTMKGRGCGGVGGGVPEEDKMAVSALSSLDPNIRMSARTA